MRALGTMVAAAIALAVAAAPASAATVERSDFAYQRALEGGGGGPVRFEPDGPMFAHAAGDFRDLRIVDAQGEQVPWRVAPVQASPAPRALPALDSGRRGPYAVALFDLGPRPGIRERLELEIPGSDFTGRAVVLGADDRDGPFTTLSATQVYDIRGGAAPARSTTAVFPPTGFRFLQVRATGVERIAGATVSGSAAPLTLIERRPREVTVRQAGSRTAVTLDLGYPVPVDELGVSASTPRYERPIRVLGSDDGNGFVPLAGGRIARFAGSSQAPLSLPGRHRYLRVEVGNGDDPPLSGLRVIALARSRALLAEGGHPRPYTALYGSPGAGPPDYDYARLPATAVGSAREGSLGAEAANPGYEPPADTRSFAARNPAVVTAALALAALALGAVGLLALRGKPAEAR